MCKLQIFLDRTADTFCGTPDYMAPEIIKGLKYNQCVDWWSFGILLYEMLIGQSPFSGCDEDELFWSICNERPHFPLFLSREANSIISSTKKLLMPVSQHQLANDNSENSDAPSTCSGPTDTANSLARPSKKRKLVPSSHDIIAKLLQKDSSKRLGTQESGKGEVMDQPFFRKIDWNALERRELIPPFKPRVVS
uniref:(California timema) hypothetical protein n=1 Tax=Timema californicum TaxID=61474 RepID=A0A7R9JGV6_TIMCA|nr:unnamed protein product [Timema californicum]